MGVEPTTSATLRRQLSFKSSFKISHTAPLLFYFLPHMHHMSTYATFNRSIAMTQKKEIDSALLTSQRFRITRRIWLKVKPNLHQYFPKARRPDKGGLKSTEAVKASLLGHISVINASGAI